MPLDWRTATLAPIPGEEPIKLRFFDIGVPEDVEQPYTTLIAVHGMSSNGSAWENSAELFKKPYRFIAHNRRGYQGSSDHYQGEAKDAVGRYMLDLAGFVKFVVEELKVPEKDGKGRGGIVLLGWSKGNASVMTLLSLLASPSSPPFPLPASVNLEPYFKVFESHLRQLILFEPPGNAVGLSPTPDYAAVLDSPKPFLQSFAEWLVPTVPEEKRHLLVPSIDTENALGDFPVWLADNSDREECARVAEIGLKHVPKNIGVGLIYCEDTVQWCIEPAKWISERLGNQPNTLVRTIPGGHHFFNITDPDIFVPAIQNLINELDNRLYH